MTSVPAPPAPHEQNRLGFLLDDFCHTHPPVTGALAVSGDGILLATSERLSGHRDRADTVAACITGVMSLGKGVANTLRAGHIENAALQLTEGWVLGYSPSERLVLVVLAPLATDLGAVQHGLRLLGEAVGDALDPGARTAGTAAGGPQHG